MIKVMIVDDEIWVRESLKLAFDWEQYGFRIVGEAEDPEEALDSFSTLSPDILITDIRMGDGNGLDLIESVRTQSPNTILIVLSGYKEFDYAKRAIENGVYAYLVKPVDDDELLELMLSIKAKIEETQNFASKIEVLDEEYDNIKSTYLQKICSGEITDTEQIEKVLTSFGITFPQEPFYLAYINPDISCEKEGGKTAAFCEAINETISHYCTCAPYSAISFPLDETKFALLIPISGSSRLNFTPAFLLNSLKLIQDDIRKKCGYTVSVGLSGGHNGSDSLATAFTEASSALRGSSVLRKEALSYYGDLLNPEQQIEWKNLDTKKVIQAVNERNHDKCIQLINGFFDRLMLQKSISFEQLQNFIAESIVIIIHSVFRSTDDIEKAFGKDFQPFAQVLVCKNADEIKQWTLQCFDTLFNDPGSHLKSSCRPEIQFAITRIRESYSSHITLEQVANEINISIYHFSRLFKAETGMTFNQFLTNYRINIAANLLTEGKYRVYEIASMVGYSNIDHFIDCFKKIYNCTPKKFQKQNGFEGKEDNTPQ